jgi:hypothetical protein
MRGPPSEEVSPVRPFIVNATATVCTKLYLRHDVRADDWWETSCFVIPHTSLLACCTFLLFLGPLFLVGETNMGDSIRDIFRLPIAPIVSNTPSVVDLSSLLDVPGIVDASMVFKTFPFSTHPPFAMFTGFSTDLPVARLCCPCGYMM